MIKQVKALLDREPFQPFQIVTSDGSVEIITDPQSVALGRTYVFVAHPNDKDDTSAFLSLRNIAKIVTLTATSL